MVRRLRALAAASVVASLAVVLAFGCGDVVDATDGVDAATDVRADTSSVTPDAPTLVGDDGSAIDAGAPEAGDAGTRPKLGACSSETECGPNGHCVEVVAGGFRTCLFPLPERQACTDSGAMGGPFDDECCGACDGGGVCSLRVSCGGAFFNPHNVCIYDACKSDSECGTNGVCIPAVDGGQRRCLMTNECRVHADCKAAPNGICAITGQIGPSSECRPYACGGDPRPSGAMRCHYGLECASDDDCDAGHCEADSTTGRPVCRPKPRAACPPPP